MKKYALLSVFGLGVFAFVVLPALAQKPETTGKPEGAGKSTDKPTQALTAQANPNANANANKTQANEPTNAELEEEEIAEEEEEDVTDADENSKGQAMAEVHRSTVASFVQDLLTVADREGGIGEQVKVIANEQASSQETVADALVDVESKGKVATFLFGTDYKNIGALRSEMVKTRNHIAQLSRLVEKTENPLDKATLETQILALEGEAQEINTFITEHEEQFSLFGWAVKLFTE